MRRVTGREIAAVFGVDGHVRHQRFVKHAAGNERIWGLWADGWAASEDADGNYLLPMWPDREYADLCRIGEWRAYVAREMSLDELFDLLPRLEQEGGLVSVFPTPEGQSVVMKPLELVEAIQSELERYR